MKLKTDRYYRLRDILNERILILDGAMGSMIQYRCGTHDTLPDLLISEQQDEIRKIHREYLEAGADIIETNSFNCNRFSLSDYGMEEESYRLSKTAAELAKSEAENFTRQNPDKPRFVAGSVGPTKHLLSLEEIDTPLNFDAFSNAYKEQINGLLDGGADIILIETVFDTLTAKSALYAIAQIEEERGEKIPIIVSATVANNAGRLLCGQSIEAFYTSIRHAGPLAVGLNCSFGSEQALSYIRRLSEIADTAVSLYPNAGLPDHCGEYHEDPESFVRNLRECFKEGLLNIVGGCCGTTPEHIRRLSETASEFKPREIPAQCSTLRLSGMEFADLGRSKELVQIGERTNVAGSAKFARLIREGNFDEAMTIAARQIQAGAGVIDVCMDDALSDSKRNMARFIRMLGADPDTAAVPVMIDSSDWNVIGAALRVSAGKSIVNSISLKDGEEEFLKKAEEIRRLGAAAVVMLFDEEGQADTFERKCEVAKRAYELLTSNGFPREDIIFDPNVLTVGTGSKACDPLALDFIKAVKWIKENLPGASVSGGISNLSFAFRGNNYIRENMHTVFLYHASVAGLDMAIVNAGMLGVYDEIAPELLVLLEDLILCRRENAVEPLIEFAQRAEAENEGNDDQSSDLVRVDDLETRIGKALKRGNLTEIETLMTEALTRFSPIEIIERLLMPQMQKIGAMFGEGKMFLPQVIKSAQVMKRAIAVLAPYMQDAEEGAAEKKAVLIATVRGDVHDIGKNIVGLVVSCNGFQVHDLGVRVEAETIADNAEKLKPTAILLSGLIAPSLQEMVNVCKELNRRGIRIPVIIGGAATSEMHTAVKIAPSYSGPVFYSPDAAANMNILASLSEETIGRNRERQEKLRNDYTKAKARTQTESAGVEKNIPSESAISVYRPKILGGRIWNDVKIEDVEPFIDWDWLLHAIEVGGNNPLKQKSGKKVLEDAKILLNEIKKSNSLKLQGVSEIFECHSEGDDIVIKDRTGVARILPMLRSENGADRGVSLADFISPERDYIALFAVTAGIGLEKESARFSDKGDLYASFLVKLIADRLAEAFARYVNRIIAGGDWGFFKTKGDGGIRVAFGYPSAPDHTLKRDVFEILEVEKSTGMRLSETSMIIPSESVCGMIMANGRYINIGKIGDAQLCEYAAKRRLTLSELKEIIPYNESN